MNWTRMQTLWLAAALVSLMSCASSVAVVYPISVTTVGTLPEGRVVPMTPYLEALGSVKPYDVIRHNRGGMIAIDFNRHMVLLVSIGIQATGGYAIGIRGAVETATELVVDVTESSPGYGCAVTTAETLPSAAVVVRRIDKPVRFVVRRPTPMPCTPVEPMIGCQMASPALRAPYRHSADALHRVIMHGDADSLVQCRDHQVGHAQRTWTIRPTTKLETASDGKSVRFRLPKHGRYQLFLKNVNQAGEAKHAVFVDTKAPRIFLQLRDNIYVEDLARLQLHVRRTLPGARTETCVLASTKAASRKPNWCDIRRRKPWPDELAFSVALPGRFDVEVKRLSARRLVAAPELMIHVGDGTGWPLLQFRVPPDAKWPSATWKATTILGAYGDWGLADTKARPVTCRVMPTGGVSCE